MAKKSGELTPMMKQFFDFKAKYPEALLLFRCGDFYETYCDDAERAAKVLGITLTRRNNGGPKASSLPIGEGGGRGSGDAMAGFPYHALDTYLPRLIRAGIRVAICDQLEDPKKTKTLVKRGVTELVTPGVVTQDNVLNTKENNFLCAVHFGKGSLGISLLDLSTGEFLCGEGSFDYCNKIIEDFQPKEVIYNREYKNQFIQQFPAKLYTFELDDWVFTLQTAQQKLHKHFKVRNLKGYGVDHLKNGIVAAGAILQYLELTQHNNISHITSIQRLDTNNFVRMDGFTLRSLELINPMSADGVSLLQVIDRTSTPMGGRLMRRWITFPLKDVKQITARHETVEYYLRNPEFRDLVDDQLHRIADLERIVSKISTGRVSPREMRSLAQAFDAIAKLKYQCQHTDRADLIKVADILDPCTEMKERIEREIVLEPPLQVGKGGTVIQRGVNAQLDDYRDIQHNGKAYLVKMQQEESERTGIASLKIGYNNVFGYYLEVRNTYKDNVPDTWIRKQTLAQAERYITPELKEYEDKIISAESKIDELEVMLFTRLVDDCRLLITKIQQDAIQVARLDCLLSFALTSMANRYIRPIIDNSTILDIKEGRHAVIETQLEIGEQYIPNDVLLQTGEQNISNTSSPRGGREGAWLPSIIIITGPNMAGKSALLRQTALIVVLAQIGCFVPATSARIGVVDRIFTRVGASDNIAHGESTFMVEMTEASNILNNVTDRSLVLFDELGRGTSTYDGISIAWAIVEYLATKVCPRTLFATHYHELNEMASQFPNIKNYNVSVRQADGRVIFLRKLVEGGSAHSFGINVAEMAGMPRQIVNRANTILHQLEAANANVSKDAKETKDNQTTITQHPSNAQMSFFQLDDPVLTQIRDTLLNLDVNNLTPIQALNKLNEIKGILKG